MNLISYWLDRVGLKAGNQRTERNREADEQRSYLSRTLGSAKTPEPLPPIPTALPLIDLGAVARYHFPLVDHGRRVHEPLVNVGETVIVGQILAKGIVSSVSGIVESIETLPFAHPSGLPALSVTIRASSNTGSQRALIENSPDSNAGPTPPLTFEQLHQCGVTGLGGAGFSTAEKLSTAHQHDIKTLLINAAECDPGIRCDEALMMEEPDSVIRGIRHLARLSQCRTCIIAIEHDKPDAIAALRASLESTRKDGDAVHIKLQVIEPAYPSGAERLLIRLVCGLEVIPPTRPAQMGVLCVNVATAHAAGRAADGHAQTTRIVTIAGLAATHPCNVHVRLGTPLSALIQGSGNHFDPEQHRLRIGGSISGYELHDAQAPVTATTNCVTLEVRTPKPEALPCIRCGACSDVCPVQLLPQQLYWHIQADDLDGAARQRVDHCIECACCDLVCPSSIELTNLFRHARSERRVQALQVRDAELAKQRHQSHTQREVAREAREQEQLQARKAALNDRAAASAAALERVRKRRKRPSS